MSNFKNLFALADRDDAVALLIELGDMPTHRVRSESGETLFLYSLYRGKQKCVEALRKRGDLTLQEAAAAGDVPRIEELIGRAPWTIQSLSADGWTAVHLAAFLGRDGDPDITPKHGYTPLMEAASNGYAAAVDVLLAAGADKTRKHPNGNTAADFAREKGHPELIERLS
jgi:ankyrin repeat protein